MATTSPTGTPEDRTARYMRRVEEHLAELPPAKRLPFLTGQRRRWIVLYERFCQRVDSGLPPEFDEHATDYVLTIAAINRRTTEEKRRHAVIPTEVGNA